MLDLTKLLTYIKSYRPDCSKSVFFSIPSEKNNTPIFHVNLSIPKFITAVKTVVTKSKFTHWIPYYTPVLEVVIYDESETMFNFIISIYI